MKVQKQTKLEINIDALSLVIVILIAIGFYQWGGAFWAAAILFMLPFIFIGLFFLCMGVFAMTRALFEKIFDLIGRG